MNRDGIMCSGRLSRRWARSSAGAGPSGAFRHVPGDQTVAAGRFLRCRHHRLAHPRMAEERALHLPGLDAEAAHLHLEVRPAEEVERAVRAASAPDRPCGRAGLLASRVSREGIRQEALGGQRRAAEVAARHAGAAHVELPDAPGRQQRERAVEHVGAAGGDRPPDRHRRLARREAVAQAVGGREGRVLGRAVAVDEVDIRQGLERPQHVRARQDVAAGHQLAQAAERREPLLHREVEEAGRQPDRRHPVALHGRVEAGHRERPGRQERQAAAVEERPPDLEGRQVERHRRQLEEDLAGAERRLGRIAHQPHHRAMADLDPLGRAGRARGVEHIGEARGRHVGARQGRCAPASASERASSNARRGAPSGPMGTSGSAASRCRGPTTAAGAASASSSASRSRGYEGSSGR